MEERDIWAGVKADYLAGEMKVREIAEKWGVSESRIYKKATSDGWKKMLGKIRQKTDENFIARAARVRARELEVISGATEKLSVLLDRTVEELSEQPTAERVKNLKGLSAVASAIQSNVETLMKLYGIQSPAQEAAQKLARQRLALEQRKQRFEEGKATEAGAAREVEVNITMEDEAEDEQTRAIREACREDTV